MNTMNKYIKMAAGMVTLAIVASCTKLDQNLNSTLTNQQAANALGAAFVLQNAYNDVGNPYSDNGNIFALEEVSADECLIPTRGSDWDDNGKWRALHQHNWTVDGVDVFLAMFNAMNKINFDATNVLTPRSKPRRVRSPKRASSAPSPSTRSSTCGVSSPSVRRATTC
ncbi:hypothetical protein ACQ86N_07530 [Puia sp. P3]|uniref:hypothetical protein n=1 Tax=Puia sp. P3 TaxID=3423952 RepID=UPI003D678F6E